MASPGYIATCCLGSKLWDKSDEASATEVLLEEKVVNIICLVFGAGSCLGIVVILYPWFRTRNDTDTERSRPNNQSPSLNHVIKCLILAGVLANFGLITRSSLWLAGFFPLPDDTAYGDFQHVSCIVFTVWVQFFFLSIVFWHLVYGLETYMICHGETSSKCVQHFIGWVVPALLCSVGIWVAYEPNVSQCASQQGAKKGSVYLVMLVPVLVVLILILCLFCRASQAVRRSLIHQRGSFSTSERHVLDTIQIKFILITIAFSVCWFPNLLNGVLVNTLDEKANDLILVFLVLQAVLNPFEVLIDVMVLYGWPKGLWCVLLRARCHGYRPIPSSNINNLDESRSWWISKATYRDGLLSFSRNQNT